MSRTLARDLRRGDTIIEMVLAFAIFSLVAVGTMNILTNGVAITQRNLESTLVQQQIDSQAEMIRYIHDTVGSSGNNKETWKQLISNVAANPRPLDFSNGSCPDRLQSGDKGFFIVPASSGFLRQQIDPATSIGALTYARIAYDTKKTQGIWTQVAEAEGSKDGARAYDFYIHACWNASGLKTPMTLGTIVRLYEK